MTKLTIHRKWYDVFGFFRKLNLFINNKKAGYLSVWNSVHTIHIEDHQQSGFSLLAKMDWCESEPKQLNLNVDDQIELVVSTNALVLWSLYITTGLLILNYIFSQWRYTMLPLELLTAIPFIYFLILRPNKFFTIDKR